MAKNATETPLMKQYYEVKHKHPDAILLFRVGDFYETFGDDAVVASKILGITLTQRAGAPLAGVPYHAIDTYLPRLVRAGQRVAICEQLEDPKTTKTIVKRGITELVTPGITMDDNVLEQKENNFLASIYSQNKLYGISFLDISTGEFLVSQGNKEYIEKLLQNFRPKEVIFEKEQKLEITDTFRELPATYDLPDWMFTEENAFEKLTRQFGSKSLKGFGVEHLKTGVIAAGAIIDYLDYTKHDCCEHIKNLARIDEDKYVWLDKFTIRNLELFDSGYENGKSLITVIDSTQTGMGGRLLKRWLSLPLKNVDAINERLNVVEFLIKHKTISEKISSQLAMVGDIERLSSKVAVLRVNPREMLQLKYSLDAIEPIINACRDAKCPELQVLGEKMDFCQDLREKIGKYLNPECPNLIAKGNVIKNGVNAELDELRKISTGGRTYLNDLERRESQRTGIPSLKVSYNNVFGYYFEVRNTHKDKVPPEWTRKQTLVNAERYINEELKEYEEKILGAEERISVIETQLFNELISFATSQIGKVQINANLVARIDCLMAFAKDAQLNNYCRPEVNDGNVLDIKEGRHPVIEKQLKFGESYISNNVFLDDKTQQIMMITGPNMSGKSALLRQTALICIMAQIGSFVPAEKAKLGIVDKIFTRVGASDNISMGESTFMVEMTEAASIMNNLSDKSLILLDELGRGTSTYDGISIAWAIAEYIHEHSKAKTLFATHYHELNEMEKDFKRIRNYNVSVQESDNKVIFLRKLQPGGSEHSFGIHVAKMAGMPKSIVYRANKILEQLEAAGSDVNGSVNVGKPVDSIAQNRDGYQLSFFQLDDPVLSQIKKELMNLDIDRLSPLEALNKLNDIKKLAGAK
ncbi:MAG: DNA mismatch repair protein MutS [Bacteroidales bacterium]|nr:DNA mismatch repair protein MutS [Bacteroidales bacterium]